MACPALLSSGGIWRRRYHSALHSHRPFEKRRQSLTQLDMQFSVRPLRWCCFLAPQSLSSACQPVPLFRWRSVARSQSISVISVSLFSVLGGRCSEVGKLLLSLGTATPPAPPGHAGCRLRACGWWMKFLPTRRDSRRPVPGLVTHIPSVLGRLQQPFLRIIPLHGPSCGACREIRITCHLGDQSRGVSCPSLQPRVP